MKLLPQAEEYFEGCHLQASLPERVQALLTPEGFNDFVQHIYQNSDMVETKCYQYAEDYFFHIFGCQRYEDYNSYKSSFHQIMSRKRELNKPKLLPMFPDYDEYSGMDG